MQEENEPLEEENRAASFFDVSYSMRVSARSDGGDQ